MNIQLQDELKRVACEKYHFGLCSIRGYRLCRMAECEKYVLLDEAKWRAWHEKRMERFREGGWIL